MTFLIQGFLSLMIQLVPIDRDLGEMFMSCTVQDGSSRRLKWACNDAPLGLDAL